MIQNLKYYITKDPNPYNNLALEEYLLKYVKENECILYLWQNENTVVIGKNQNPWKECRITELKKDGGRLVRRLSGGGAVYHDLGNLNFTFLVRKKDYDLDKQLQVIIQAAENLGIHAVKTGRNDITVEDRKFSGNAFYSDGIYSYHHGTLLVNVDMDKLSYYLNVSKDKLASKGVDSVKSRVINLSKYNETLTIEKMQQEIIKAFEKVYECKPFKLEKNNIDWNEVCQLTDKYCSWEWIYGKKLEFNYEFTGRFSWGGVELQLIIDSGYIKDCKVYSDAMDTLLFEELPNVLNNKPFSLEEIVGSLRNMQIQNRFYMAMVEDIIEMIKQKGI